MPVSEERLQVLLPRQLKESLKEAARKRGLSVGEYVRLLIDAFRIAHVELVEWLVDEYGFEKLEAFQVLSQVGSARVANVVDPNYTVVAKFPKAMLPGKR